MPSIPQIQIEQQMGAIGINHTRAQIQINPNHPEVRITQQRAEINIEQKQPQVKVDNTRPNSAQGRKKPVAFTATAAQKGRSMADRGTRRFVGEAKYVGDVTKKGVNRIANNATQRTRELGTTEIHIDALEMNPEVEWEPGYVQISWQPHSVTVEVDGEIAPDIYVEPTHSLEIYLRDKPYITITVPENTLPPVTGRHVNENI